MNRTGWPRKAARVAGFLAVFALLFGLAGAVLQPKWVDTSFRATYTISGFYDQPRGSIDVIYLGSSRSAHAVEPLALWKETGITSYSLATGRQPPLASYYLLEEAVRLQHPSVLFLEAGLFTRDEAETAIGPLHWALDPLRLSLVKIRAAAEIARRYPNERALDYVFPLLNYHERWAELGAADFLSTKPRVDVKGADQQFRRAGLLPPETYMQLEAGVQAGFEPAGYEFLLRIMALCEREHISLVLYEPPALPWTLAKSELLTLWAAEQGIPFIDFNRAELLEEIGLDFEADFFDAGYHLNAFGAEKVTAYLGEFLQAHYSLQDQRGHAEYRNWDEAYQRYLRLRHVGRLTGINELAVYLRHLDDPNYIILIVARHDAALNLQQAQMNGMEALGLTAAFRDCTQCVYAAVIDSGSVITETASLEPLRFSYNLPDGDRAVIRSTGDSASRSVSILVNDILYTPDRVGLSIVVYDKQLGFVVDAATFNTSAAGRAGKRPPQW